ncbi:hypothetical protein OIU34_20145 [Pararhizobium sp. BT-229]|uniref:hypothetical protein n=1 Tax=Pararhizobium sp. BT-229 TaxID=2986923 RepID=UPI0021F77EB4|nr:hypothetical protein [Pararhizobium sp. BT-229]MCV9964199.1 hypothetical protein [Pararhizobium sp. BT-229]
MNAANTELTEGALSTLIGVAQAHGDRTRARLTARSLKKAYDEAKGRLKGAESAARMFFMHDDCGPEYEDEHTQAKSAFEIMQRAFNEAVATEIECEMAYKKARLTAIDQYPHLEDVIARNIQKTKEPQAS